MNCKVDNCSKSKRSAGFCTLHYQRYKKYGDPLFFKRIYRSKGLVCSKDGCNEVYHAKDLCKKHYMQSKTGSKEYINKRIAYGRTKKGKEVAKKTQKIYHATKVGRGKLRFYDKKRKTAKKKSLPKWANLKKIEEIYLNCPEGCHVDHIIPLQGKNICGLHVESNLQYLTKDENIKKRNKFDGTLENNSWRLE
jgi:hypothetical protein